MDNIETLNERLGCKPQFAVHDAVRCVKKYHPHMYERKWSYAERGFPEGKLCWIKWKGYLYDRAWGIFEEHDLNKVKENECYFRIVEEPFEALQESESYMTYEMLRLHFKRTIPIKAPSGQSVQYY